MATKPVVKAWVFPSSTNDEKVYQTLKYNDGTLSCDCPGWTRRVDRNGKRTCKHVRLVEMGLADQQSLSRRDYVTQAATIKNVQTTNKRAFQFEE